MMRHSDQGKTRQSNVNAAMDIKSYNLFDPLHSTKLVNCEQMTLLVEKSIKKDPKKPF
jgi:hypothetical protein